ncbi:hypothetical protein [Methylobacterium sp. Leaf100]|uniref:hypothetical protein n=1 Tax=Methylobacterium sp. Leaf100 TaxID=1736252 RepID=UPI0006F5FEF2|nr:hypothetical protein [Methylobacterium sp. Leaf100]KQP20205.1 hypothetical protein ASF25_09935 [Methylobacterium sp. Leaf100]
MRYGSCSVCSAALMGVLWIGGPAQAQSGPGWIDPPAKTEGKAQGMTETKGDAAKAGSGSEPEARTGARMQSDSGTPRASARAEPSPPAAVRRPARPSARYRGPEDAPPRRLSRVPAVPATPMATAAPATSMASADRFPEWAAAAERLSDDYLDSVSAPGLGLVTAAPRFYGERVRFHGRVVSLAALMAEKRHFAARWPVRRYEPQSGATRTACNAATATCIVRTTFDYRAENPARGTRAQGVSDLVLTIDLSGPRPVIVSETSRVLRRYGPGPLGAIAGRTRGA